MEKKMSMIKSRSIVAIIMAVAVLLGGFSVFSQQKVYGGQSAHGKSYNDKLILDSTSNWTAVLKKFTVNGKNIKVASVSRTGDYDLKINTASHITYYINTISGEESTQHKVVYTTKFTGKKVIIPRNFSFKIIAADYANRPDAAVEDGATYTYLNYKNQQPSIYIKSPKIKSVKHSGKSNRTSPQMLYIYSSCKALKSFNVTQGIGYVKNMSKKTKIKIAKKAGSHTLVFSVTKIKKSYCANKKWWKARMYQKVGKYHTYHYYG
jgi:virulence-associated protein VapD